MGPWAVFTHWSRRDLSCRMEVGLEHIIMLEQDRWALGQILIWRGAHDTHCREGVHTTMCIVQRTTNPRASRNLT